MSDIPNYVNPRCRKCPGNSAMLPLINYSFRFAIFWGMRGASRVREPLRLFFLSNNCQPAARAGPGWGGYGRDGLRHTVIGVVRGVVAFIFLLLMKLPIGIEVVTGAQGAQAEHGFRPG